MSRPELFGRLGLLLAATILGVAGAPGWLGGPLGLISLLATAELTVRPFAPQAHDRLLLVAGSTLVALLIGGLLLNFVAGGLTRISWSLGALVVGLIVLARRQSYGTRLVTVRSPQLGSRFIAAAVTSLVLLVVAVVVAIDGTRAGARASVVALSLVSELPNSIVVRVSSTDSAGNYRLIVSARGQVARRSSLIEVPAGGSIDREFAVTPGTTWTVLLTSPADPSFSRLLIVDTPK